MPTAFWYWLLMVIWAVWGILLNYRNRAQPTFYWGIGWSVFIFILFLLIGLKIFPDPFSTLVRN